MIASSLRALAGEASAALRLHERIGHERREALGALANRWLGPRGLHQYGRMPLVHPDLPFVVLWSQKAGSTALVKWFFAQTGLLETAQGYSPWIHDYETQVFKRAPGYAEAVRSALASGAPVVKIVRDPAARAFSGFLEMNRMRVLREGLDHWSVYWRKRLVRSAHGPAAAYDRPVSFNAFLDWLAGEPAATLNGHIAPQASRIEDALAAPAQIFKADAGPEVFARLEEAFDLPRTPPEKLAALAGSGHHHRKAPLTAEALAAFAAADFPIDRTPETVFPRIDAAAASAAPALDQRIRRVYGGDYRRYDY